MDQTRDAFREPKVRENRQTRMKPAPSLSRIGLLLVLPFIAAVALSCADGSDSGGADPDEPTADSDTTPDSPPSQPGSTITIQVVDSDGNGVEGVFIEPATVEADPPHNFPEIASLTDADGEFEFQALPPGTYEFTIWAEPEEREGEQSAEVDVADGDDETVEFVLELRS